MLAPDPNKGHATFYVFLALAMVLWIMLLLTAIGWMVVQWFS